MIYVSDEKYVKTSLSIRENLFIKGKLLASIRNKSFTDILNTALEEYLNANDDEIEEKLSIIINKLTQKNEV